MARKPEIITEKDLAAFRAEKLSPAAVLASIERHVQVLLRLPVGVGKTFAAQALLVSKPLYQRFDLVIYAAPAWNILEDVIAKLDAEGECRFVVLRARPVERCGDLNAEWEALEAQGCSVLAKRAICKDRCPHSKSCRWPEQMSKQRLAGVQLVLMTDQRIGLVRQIVPLVQDLVEATRPLTILDEVHVLDGNFEVHLSHEEIERFREALASTSCHMEEWPAAKAAWMGGIRRLQRSEIRELLGYPFPFTSDLHSFAFYVQHRGLRLFGSAFRYTGYDLSLLRTSRPEERWVDDDGIRFIARPYLDRHLLLLSAHLDADYVGHRLGGDPVASPFANHRFMHTGTRVVNLRNGSGADTHFTRDPKSVLDLFAVLIARNVHEGRTTLLISRKKSKELCAKHLEARLAGWGVHVQILAGDSPGLPATPDARLIPIIHYGILGVNDFAEYECAYCLNSYYVSPKTLNEAVQQFEPRHFRVDLRIVRGADYQRRVELTDPGVSDEGREWLAAIYLCKLEVDPVIQAVGRNRFLTKPREVVTFQMNDLAREIGHVEDVRSLTALAEALDVPRAREIDHALLGRRAEELMAGGTTAEQVAVEMGVHRATVFRRLSDLKSRRFPYIDSLRESATLPTATGGEE